VEYELLELPFYDRLLQEKAVLEHVWLWLNEFHGKKLPEIF
jgi:hypothetical protein